MPHGVVECLSDQLHEASLLRGTQGERGAARLDSHRNACLQAHALGQVRDCRHQILSARRTVAEVPDGQPRFVHRPANLDPSPFEQLAADARGDSLCVRGGFEQGGDSDGALDEGVVHLSGQAVAFVEHRSESTPQIAHVQAVGSPGHSGRGEPAQGQKPTSPVEMGEPTYLRETVRAASCGAFIS